MKRRDFLKTSGIFLASIFVTSKIKAISQSSKIIHKGSEFKKRILNIISTLKKESTNLVKKIMDGKKYIFDPFTHYPYDGGIKDKTTGCQLFFHAHRKNEYGHFHTFATNEKGELIHLILISMDREGKPIGLATVNRWVTGDTYVKSSVLKALAKDWYMDPSQFKDARVIQFINNMFKSFSDEINNLFDERDDWIKNYVNKYYKDPFEDRNFEVLSSRKINLFV